MIANMSINYVEFFFLKTTLNTTQTKKQRLALNGTGSRIGH